ncbi:MAG: type II toxin-antitoxin system HicA family toxin [Nitrospirae bacterium]|nr:type II toxin-antitoxin system HicA family toxin [Nitrospirota bacterium]
MKLPRDLSAVELEKALRKAFGYQFSRQVGSHRRLVTQIGGEHHLTIPNHNTIKPGTFRAIIGEVAAHHRISINQVLEKLT